MENTASRMAEVATLMHVAQSIEQRLKSSDVSSHIVRELGDPVSSILQMLESAEKSGDGCRTLESLWVREVGRAVYEASDLLDVEVANNRSKLHRSSLFGSCSGSMFGVRNNLQINRLRDELYQLCQRGTIMEPSVPLEKELLQGQRSDVDIRMMDAVARESDKEEIVKSLLDTSDPKLHIGVVPIFGSAGSGKTTLAKLVYNDERIAMHFDLKLWVNASNTFNIREILESIIICSASSTRIGDLDSKERFNLVADTIGGKLFLLVLDDVWVKSIINWTAFKNRLKVGARGSKILLTSRPSKKIENIASTKALILDLDGPSDDHSQNQLRDISFDKLELKYIHLPSILKPCFALCSIFPNEEKNNIIDLVSFWMAHGLLEDEKSAEDYIQQLRSLEFINVEEDEYGKLVSFKMRDSITYDFAQRLSRHWQTMIHLSIQKGDKKLLLQMKAMDDDHELQTFLCWIAPNDEDDVVGGMKEINDDDDDVGETSGKIDDVGETSGINEDGGGMIRINNIMEMSKFKSLRVLDLHAFNIEMLPDSIGNLIHLRYLDLSQNESLKKLPNSITNLHHLQTLKLEFCYKLKELPTSFGKLCNLRRLELDGCEKLTFMPPNFKNLSSLQTLSRYLVGRPQFKSFSGLKSLEKLNHLRGRLMIELSENWTTAVNEAAKSNLYKKNQLKELGIKWGATRHTGQDDEIKHEQLIDGLQPPRNLKGLKIEGYKGKYFPKWARGNELATSLPNLINVSIDGCGECKTLPRFSCLQHLKRLSLRFMHSVQFFENSVGSSSASESPFFPSLEELTLKGFYSLEGWWKDATQMQTVSFHCLQKLKIWSCPKLKSMPFFPKVKVLDLQNINEKLIEFHIAPLARSELETSTLAPSSNSEISTSEQTEQSENLQLLQSLNIKGCPRLKTLAFASTSKKLKKLVVERLDMLSSLTEVLKQLYLLEELEIAGCKVLDLSGGCQGSCDVCEECRPWKNLSKLQRLTLRELPKLVSLPVGLRFTKTLRILSISTCNNFNALPEYVRNLTSLQHLRLEGCPELAMLPEGLKEIHSLVKIVITECTKLMEQRQEGGEDWHKIEHAQVLCHNSWRYDLMSDVGILQKPRNHGGNVIVRSEDPTIHVDVTVRRK